ncbi:hypothetical protein QR680_004992 [Steinernema hermaphroditum]|uniref:Uncharacterized protein n=1 Tax=Steinernema hermaphroditum TaxID=289476 RepID=A0AA39HRW3_9BILA|nr:hypothetical protein QR680_004992 [Steinernema hermaphroditum]
MNASQQNPQDVTLQSVLTENVFLKNMVMTLMHQMKQQQNSLMEFHMLMMGASGQTLGLPGLQGQQAQNPMANPQMFMPQMPPFQAMMLPVSQSSTQQKASTPQATSNLQSQQVQGVQNLLGPALQMPLNPMQFSPQVLMAQFQASLPQASNSQPVQGALKGTPQKPKSPTPSNPLNVQFPQNLAMSPMMMPPFAFGMPPQMMPAGIPQNPAPQATPSQSITREPKKEVTEAPKIQDSSPLQKTLSPVTSRQSPSREALKRPLKRVTVDGDIVDAPEVVPAKISPSSSISPSQRETSPATSHSGHGIHQLLSRKKNPNKKEPEGPRPVSGRRQSVYCSVCQDFIFNDTRSQGPQRHIQQKHMKDVKFFLCPAPNCDYGSNYDVHQVVNHLNHMHKDRTYSKDDVVNRKPEFDAVIEEWREKCFGKKNKLSPPRAPSIMPDFDKRSPERAGSVESDVEQLLKDLQTYRGDDPREDGEIESDEDV